MARVFFSMGNIFEASADLTVLPCSIRGTVSQTTRKWLQLFGIPDPHTLNLRLQLGDVSDPIAVLGPNTTTRFVSYAASVMSGTNGMSTPEAIEKIGSGLGALTTAYPEIRLIESPLLGTGAGGLNAETAGQALYRGFMTTAGLESILYVFVFDQERLTKLEGITTKQRKCRVWDAVGLRPGLLGVSIDLKKLFSRKK